MFPLRWIFIYPPASKASREVANLTERKNPQTPVYGVKEFVCLSVRQSVTNFDPNYLRIGRTEIFFRQSMGTQNGNFTKDSFIVPQTSTKNHLKKSLQVWLP